MWIRLTFHDSSPPPAAVWGYLKQQRKHTYQQCCIICPTFRVHRCRTLSSWLQNVIRRWLESRLNATNRKGGPYQHDQDPCRRCYNMIDQITNEKTSSKVRLDLCQYRYSNQYAIQISFAGAIVFFVIFVDSTSLMITGGARHQCWCISAWPRASMCDVRGMTGVVSLNFAKKLMDQFFSSRDAWFQNMHTFLRWRRTSHMGISRQVNQNVEMSKCSIICIF